MSLNRENMIWQSADGTWNRGFFVVLPGDTSDPDYDDEWDVDYDQSSFDWVSTGLPTEEAAHRSWHGANPGGSNTASSDQADHFDDMAAKLYARKNTNQYAQYFGPPKHRKLGAIRKELDKALDQQRWYKIDGYANDLTAEVAELTKQWSEAQQRVTDDGETERMHDAAKVRTNALQKGLDSRREKMKQNARYSPYGSDAVRRNTEKHRLLDELELEIASRRLEEARWPSPEQRAQDVEKASSKQGRKGNGEFDVVTHGEPPKLS